MVESLSDRPKHRLRSYGLFSVPAPSIRSNAGRRGFSALSRAHQETQARVAADVARFGIKVHAFLGQPALDARARRRSSGDAESRPAGGLCSGAGRCRRRRPIRPRCFRWQVAGPSGAPRASGGSDVCRLAVGRSGGAGELESDLWAQRDRPGGPGLGIVGRRAERARDFCLFSNHRPWRLHRRAGPDLGSTARCPIGRLQLRRSYADGRSPAAHHPALARLPRAWSVPGRRPWSLS